MQTFKVWPGRFQGAEADHYATNAVDAIRTESGALAVNVDSLHRWNLAHKGAIRITPANRGVYVADDSTAPAYCPYVRGNCVDVSALGWDWDTVE